MANLAFFFALWPYNGLEIQRGNQPFLWYFEIIFWLWRFGFHLVHTTKFQQDVQGDILLTILSLSIFSNIVTTTIFHVNRCELTKWKRFLTENLPSGSTMINRWWCYNCYVARSRWMCGHIQILLTSLKKVDTFIQKGSGLL